MFFQFLPIDGALGDGDVAGGGDEAGEFVIGHRVHIEKERGNGDTVRGTFVGEGIGRITPHGELAAGNENHAGRNGGRPAGGEGQSEEREGWSQ